MFSSHPYQCNAYLIIINSNVEMRNRDITTITFCHLLGMKGSSDVSSIDVFLILVRFSINMLYFVYSILLLLTHTYACGCYFQ